MIKLAVVIITFNEETNIKRCLDAVQDIADEIIVVDSFSTDKTKAICEGYKDLTFVEHAWEGYSATKNYANSLATSDYILSLDADEVLSKELKEAIYNVKQNAEFAVYSLTRLTNYCGKWVRHCGWYPDVKNRLFRKDVARWEGDIHEQLSFDQSEKVGLLKGDLLHYSFHNIEQHIQTINKFSSITAESRFKKGKRTNLLNIIFKPMLKFFNLYIFKLGILDGYFGYVICINSAYSAFLKEIKLKQFYKTQS